MIFLGLLLAVAVLAVRPSRAAAAPFSIERFTTSVTDGSTMPFSQAGGHPLAASTEFEFVGKEGEDGLYRTAGGEPKAVEVDLPPGFIGDPQAAPQCPNSLFVPGDGGAPECPAASAVGFVNVAFVATSPGHPRVAFNQPVYNVVPPPGVPAAFGFIFIGLANFPVLLEAKLRSDGDYGLTVGTGALASTVTASEFTFCEDGIVGSPSNGGGPGTLACAPVGPGGKAFLSLPTRCPSSAPATTLRVSTYQEPSAFSRITSFTGAPSGPPAAQGGPPSEGGPVGSPGVPGGSYLTGCQALTGAWVGPGGPTFSFQPEDHGADSPSGYKVDLHVPQAGLAEPQGLATSHLDDTTVVLPEGVSLSPSAADGLQACTPAQIGLTTPVGQQPPSFDLEEPHCPQAAKVGIAEVDTPLLDEPLKGSVYLAQQEANPFASKFAIYLAIDDEKTGVVVKLAGKVEPNPATGQITATFAHNPQLPFEDFKLDFFGGPRAALANPVTCGTKTVTTALTPWSAADPEHPGADEIATPSDRFSIDSGAGGSGCPETPGQRPFALGFKAGTAGPLAGEHSPFTLDIRRPDGTQELDRIEAVLPPGLTAALAGVPYCADAAIAAAATKTGKAEQAGSSCPAASQIGSTTVAAGAGSDPFHVSGGVYLAGPYDGAPLSLAFIVPAVAGPFDLGVQVVRAALYVNPETAQITARSDPLPKILAGVPLRIREVRVDVDRPAFTLNPTSCDEMAVSGVAHGTSGATAALSNRFQVGGCGALPFKPNLKLRLKGATKRIGHPALKAVLTARPGEANIGRAQVNLPHGEFLDQGNLNKTCTKPVLLAGNCPKNSIYGRAEAWTPLLEKPLQGNVYLVGGYGFKLPALVADLNGQIRVTLIGKVDSGPNKGIRNTFEVVPDAPVSRFVLEMKGGKRYGLLENSENLCKAKKARRRAIVRFTGQNGKVRQFKPVVANQCRNHRR